MMIRHTISTRWSLPHKGGQPICLVPRLFLLFIFCLLFSPVVAQTVDDDEVDPEDEITVTDKSGNEEVIEFQIGRAHV